MLSTIPQLSQQIGRVILKNDNTLHTGFLNRYKLDLVIARDYKKTKREVYNALNYQETRDFDQAIIKNDVTILLRTANRSAGGKNSKKGRANITKGFTNTGFISQATQRKIKNIGELWQNSIMAATVQYHNYAGMDRKRRRNQYPNNLGLRFITLTIPGMQMHTDQDLKRNLLNSFLGWLKYQGAKNYIWRAETQKTGKLHFHIITDQYVDKDKLNKYWSGILLKYGYQGGENAANIKGVKGDQLKSYISKYISKNAQGGRSIENAANPLKYYGLSKYRLIETATGTIRAVEGKIWGASRKLTSLITQKVIDHFKIDLQQYAGYIPDLLKTAQQTIKTKTGEMARGVIEEFHAVIFNRMELNNPKNVWGPVMYFAYLVHHRQNFNLLYYD